ncbi:MrcB family domain-containing protein [Schumannella sp. 10F1B-5-1]|uniref:MrcB family domain-containing protein n=1 Tax=Schumannella sp. 10F1B-5-1 TaxID=2590780 RepID=UPI0011313585|nr:DUF3578 domain-containing protein [Schumannella sp. 10F1B-5-1]TPW73036.1 DUF3578 domain-containing protein [Schumannella sp. 10F1B-5-1]
MALYDFITAVAATYERRLDSDGHRILATAPDTLDPLLPAGYIVRSGGGKGRATLTPWFAVLDPDETSTPQDGMYVVYIFSADLRQVTLLLGQGATRLSDDRGWSVARERLLSDASTLRGALGSAVDDLQDSFELGDRGKRALSYMAGGIVSKTYEVGALPDDSVLERDLARFMSLYVRARIERSNHAQLDPGSIVLPARPLVPSELAFAPKSDEDYLVSIRGVEAVARSRRHETIVRELGEILEARGHEAGTNVHPIDLEVLALERRWMIEVKVVRNGDARAAVREAIGQLFEYRYFLRRDQPVTLTAAFSEPVGDAYVQLLQELGIEAIWKSRPRWEGTPDARFNLLA